MGRRAVVGLDIGTSAVRAAQLGSGRKGPQLERFGQVALPEGAVRDGEVQSPEVVAAALRQLWVQTRFSTREVVIGVANQRVVVRQVDLPWMPPKELRASLALQVQDFIPMPVDQAILDVHLLQDLVDDAGARVQRVLLVAASRDMVERAVQAVTLAGLTPTGCDLTSFAALRGLVRPGALAPVTAEALVDVGAGVTNIVVHQGGVPRFVRILLMGGADITHAVAERLGLDLPEAESVKRTVGLAPGPGAGEPHPANRAIEMTGASFVEEVRGSLDYYAAQPGALPLARIVLSGGGSRLAGLPERLAHATRLPVEAGHPLERLGRGRLGLSEDQLAHVEPQLAVPVGLATGVAA